MTKRSQTFETIKEQSFEEMIEESKNPKRKAVMESDSTLLQTLLLVSDWEIYSDHSEYHCLCYKEFNISIYKQFLFFPHYNIFIDDIKMILSSKQKKQLKQLYKEKIKLARKTQKEAKDRLQKEINEDSIQIIEFVEKEIETKQNKENK